MENPKKPDQFAIQIATAGEALIDLIGRRDGLYEPCLGGAVFNLTRALARQGVGTLYLNPLSGDRFGRALAAALLADGVQLAQPAPVPEVTSLAVVDVNAAGQPDYAFYREGVADRAISAKSLVEACQAANQPAVVCTGALALSPEDADIYLPWLQAQRQGGKTVVVDANLRPSVMADLAAYRSHVLAALQLADVIKVSDEDLDVLATPGQDAVHKAQHLLRTTTARVVALTQGSAGAALVTRGGAVFHARESNPLTVVDTVGAGDCFLAGLLVAMLDDARPPTAWLDALGEAAARRLLTHAVASASLCVMRRGCVPPSREEVNARVSALPCEFGVAR